MSTSITKQGILKADGESVGENLIATGKAGSGYNVSNFVNTTNVSVPEWGCTDAQRATGSDGTATNNIIMTLGPSPGIISQSGTYYSYSIYVKNNHSTNPIRFTPNSAGSYTPDWLQPGEAKRIIVANTPGNGSNYLAFNFRTQSTGAEFDFTYWRPKIEIGQATTPWTPALTDDIYVGEHGFFEGFDTASVAKGYFNSNEFYEY